MFLGDYYGKGVVITDNYYHLFPSFFLTQGKKKRGLVPYTPICFFYLKKKIEKFKKIDPSFSLKYAEEWKDFLREKFTKVYRRYWRNLKIKKGEELIEYEYKGNPPYHHQKIGTTLLIENEFYALFCEQGTGKTRMVVDACSYLCKRGEISKILISAPIPIVKSGWMEEFRKFATVDYTFYDAVYTSSGDRLKNIDRWIVAKKQKGRLHVLFIGYDYLWRLFPTLLPEKQQPSVTNKLRKLINMAIKFSGANKRDELLRRVKKEGNMTLYWMLRRLFGMLGEVDVVVADESHKLKSYSAKRTKGFMLLSQNAKRVYILSGTPMTNSPLDIYAQAKVMHPYFFSTKKAFIENLTETVITKGGFKKYVKANHNKLEEIINSFSFIVKKEEVLNELPEKVFVVRDVIMTQKTFEVYKRVVDELASAVVDVENKEVDYVYASNIFAKLVKLNQITGGVVYTENNKSLIIGKEKVETLKQVLEEIGKEQVVVWANFKGEIKLIKEELQKEGYGVKVITGETPVKERTTIIEDFVNQRFQVLVANPKTIGTGVTLTNAHYCVYYSLTFNLEDWLQSQDRLHRIGQKHVLLISCCLAYCLQKNTNQLIGRYSKL